jgi:CheY-like chemotaxis protein
VVPVDTDTLVPATEAPPKHVVCVDDNEPMLPMVERWLTRRGYRVSAYADPEVALAAVRESPMGVDMVVTDFHMPGMSGLVLAEALTALRPDLPIVLSSGYVSDELLRNARRCGVREVIYKEDTIDKLGAVLQYLLEEKA